MLVIMGTFEDERFIPDRPISIPQNKKAVVIIEENPNATLVATVANPARLTKTQIVEWAKSPDVQALIGALKGTDLPADIDISGIRNERLAEKYKT